MKKQLLVALAVTAMSAATAFAAVTTGAGGGVLGSVHDMNVVGNNVTPDNQGRVCAFCHTPHHAITQATDAAAGEYMPLWSHNLTTQAFTQYDSGTYDANDVGVIDPLVGPSRLCMSCHDGVIAVDQHYGASHPGTATFAQNEFTGAEWQIGIGAAGALDRTHPIGFKLADAITADRDGSNVSGVQGIFADAATTRTFNGSATKTISSQLYDGYMTCATCHDVHNRDNVANVDVTVGGNTYDDQINRNYLVFATQAGSQLCLSCHDK